jgi:RNA polymerase sigma factor (TIGR02999 family)
VSDVTRILSAIEEGDPQAPGQLLPLVYDELRRLAASQMARERPGQTLDATSLVHEAYLRLVGPDVQFANRAHFFAAAAEAMRRILIEAARRKGRQKHGGGRKRVPFDSGQLADAPAEEFLALDEALNRLEAADPQAAAVVKLRCFGGLTMPQVADALGMPLRSAEREWTYARTWLRRALADESDLDTDRP